MRNIFIIFAVVLLMAGCDRDIASKDPIRTVPDNPPKPINVRAEIGQQTITLYWEMTDSSDISRFRIYTATSQGTDFMLRDSTTAYFKTLSGLQHNQRYYFRIAAVYGTLESDRSDIISAEANNLSIVIEDDIEYINTQDIYVQTNVPSSTTHIKMSEDPNLAGAKFDLFQGTQTSFTLSKGDGLKTIYAEFLFEDGSKTAAPLSDDIILDTRAEIASVSFSPASQTFSAGDTIHFTLTTTEIKGNAWVTFGSGEGVDLYDEDADMVYTGYWIVPTNYTLNNGIVTGHFTDQAGNEAPEITDEDVINVASDPLPVTLLASGISSFQAELTWTEAVGDGYAAYRIYRDSDDTVDNNSLLIKSVTSRSSTSYTDTTLDANTSYYYVVYTYDNSGLYSVSNIAQARTQVNSAPEAIELFVIPAAGDTTGTLKWTQSNDDDFGSYRIYKSSAPGVTTSGTLAAFITSRSTTTFSYGSDDIGKYFIIYVYDRHGLSTPSNEVRINP